MDNENCCKEENCCKGVNKNIFNLLALLVCFFLIAVTVFFVANTQNKLAQSKNIEPRNNISVSGTGEVYVKPDLALMDFSVTTERATVNEALASNAEQMNGVINYIKSQGVDEKDIKTTDFSISPRYEYQNPVGVLYNYYIQNGKRVLVGYDVTQQLGVKIRDLGKIGQIIQGASDAGANQVGDLQFTIDKPEEFQKQARAQAIEEAKAKAAELTSQVGVKLGKIVSFSEGFYSPVYDVRNMAAPAGAGEAEAPQIQPGQSKITSTITITYEIK